MFIWWLWIQFDFGITCMFYRHLPEISPRLLSSGQCWRFHSHDEFNKDHYHWISMTLISKVRFSRGTRTICEGCECRKNGKVQQSYFMLQKIAKPSRGFGSVVNCLRASFLVRREFQKKIEISCERFPHPGSCFTRDLFSNMS